MFKVQLFEARTLKWWFTRRNDIDFDPPYQRKGNIWSKYDQAYLIDSMINGFDIPKIYVADFTYSISELNRGKYWYAIIDGKQRLQSIFSFLDNKLPLNKDFIYFKNQKIKLGGYSHKDIQKEYPEIAEEFENFNLTIISVITDEAEKIDEMFIRLNRSKPLTGSELRSAMPGPIPKIINRLALHEFFDTKIRFQRKRKSEYNLVAKIFLVEYNNDLVNTMKRNLDRFVTDNEKKEEEDFINISYSINDQLDNLSKIFIDSDPLLKSSGPVLIYYWLTKQTSTNKHQQIRPFLIYFNKLRNEIENLADEDIKEFALTNNLGRDPLDLLKYNVSLRSINNQKNLKIAFEILYSWFKYYVKRI